MLRVIYGMFQVEGTSLVHDAGLLWMIVAAGGGCSCAGVGWWYVRRQSGRLIVDQDHLVLSQNLPNVKIKNHILI